MSEHQLHEPSAAPEGSAPDLDASERRLVEVEAALERLEAGSYGRCATCGEPIKEEALAADPVRDTCERCRQTAGEDG